MAAYDVMSMSGCSPASHEICKNNAIIMTVYKVPEVNILVKVKKKIYITSVLFFFLLFFYLLHFK